MKSSTIERLIPLLLCAIIIVSVTQGSVAHAESNSPFCEGEACFPAVVSPFDLTLKKATQARYRYYGFLVFDSALYLESPDVLKGDFLGNKACALRLCYRRTLTAEEFRRSGSETLALNPTAPIVALRERVDRLQAQYVDMHDGDCYQLSFKPGTGTELSRNDVPQIVIPGDDFARSYLGIWLSPYSFSESLAKKLTTPPE